MVLEKVICPSLVKKLTAFKVMKIHEHVTRASLFFLSRIIGAFSVKIWKHTASLCLPACYNSRSADCIFIKFDTRALH